MTIEPVQLRASRRDPITIRVEPRGSNLCARVSAAIGSLECNGVICAASNGVRPASARTVMVMLAPGAHEEKAKGGTKKPPRDVSTATITYHGIWAGRDVIRATLHRRNQCSAQEAEPLAVAATIADVEPAERDKEKAARPVE